MHATVGAFAVLANVQITIDEAQIAAGMFFLANCQVAMVDLLCQV